MGDRKPKLSKPQVNKGKHVNAPEDVIEITNYAHPIFCFRFLHHDHCLEQCDADEKVSFIEQLIRLSTQTWQSLTLTQRHGMGSEKIVRNAIRVSIPSGVTNDVDFLSFRFQGLKPFIGFRNRFVFHIVYIDKGFEVYKH